jgi:hypothetical protein
VDPLDLIELEGGWYQLGDSGRVDGTRANQRDASNE